LKSMKVHYKMMLPTSLLAFALSTASTSAATTAQKETREFAYVHYFSDQRSVIAWRVLHSENGTIFEMDFPEQRTLSDAEAKQLQADLQASQRRFSQSLGSYRIADMQIKADPRATQFDSLVQKPKTPILGVCSAIDFSPRRLDFMRSPPTPRFVARMRIAQCPPAIEFAGVGTAFFIAPELAMTAAHVVIDDGTLQYCDYLLTPGANSQKEDLVQPYGHRKARVKRLGREGQILDSLALEGEISAAHINADWAILSVEALATDAQVQAWPILVFSDSDNFGSIGRVIKTGYPRGSMTRALRPAGASLSALGFSLCSGERSTQAFALLADFGDSGSPIWTLPEDHPQEWGQIVSILAVSESWGSVPRAFGPNMSMRMYRAILATLASK
jgi:hypothetical protein